MHTTALTGIYCLLENTDHEGICFQVYTEWVIFKEWFKMKGKGAKVHLLQIHKFHHQYINAAKASPLKANYAE